MYCIPRSTIDADFVVDMDPQKWAQFSAELAHTFRREDQIAFETVTGKTQHNFHHRKTGFLVEVFEADLTDAHERSRFERRVRGVVEGRECYVATAEDIIIQKLRWYIRIGRKKDVDDARDVLAEQGASLDWPYIERWCSEHHTIDLLNELRAEAGLI